MKSFQELVDFLAIDLQEHYLPQDNEAILTQALKNLFTNSSEMAQGGVFLALAGTQKHGIEFLDQALEKGAVCVITDKMPAEPVALQIPLLMIDDLAQRLAGLADWFYQRPSQKIKVIGITGTNGKTSTAHYIAQIFSQSYSVAILGTLGNGVFGALLPSANTTLEVVSLNRKLYEFVQLGVDYVVMEVSSHAIALGRIQNIRFEALALTQVTRDHLDFHETEEAYRETKARLFLEFPAKFRVLNLSDELGKSLMETLVQSVGEKVFGYALNDDLCNQARMNLHPELDASFTCVTFQELTLLPSGMEGEISISNLGEDNPSSTQISQMPFLSNLMGSFNAENLLCAVTVALGCGLDFPAIEDGIKLLSPVSGRMEKVNEHPLILIDYAHTPDALDSALNAVKQHFSTEDMKLWLVFGCGGDRDAGKRPLMGKVAEQLSDQIVITDDNPRNEDPEQIADQIRQGMSSSADVEIIHDRAQAIEYAIRHAEPQDVVLIAGKGHENYQEIQGQRYFMSDAVLTDLTLRDLEKETNT
ncbi:UDP-N-acetylmuramoyl-L-alanyl-D-glutamate--2,6-diaminopimelate ligase [Hydrogenovibrio kuenenii]|uniref:UDP-N-acetylmuramoyl-L-alanyl-D-glutamate--2, 6-diaminopimelate ligase n=1 Tax=Hydrogenovibrio kuenenii TaxID=63658 RepID=UPI00046476AB|nr:UDP-N-acetylmuramoyl-L-alanyl-D-glutamate--2,6-diaminopimelate ligase [Hydrogenovibrio kuenenii]